MLTVHGLTLINIYFLCRSLVSYSDACGGQNRDHTIVGFLSELHRRGRFERIDHKYLERGHTYLECDTDFSQIEKRKKSTEVFLPQDWATIIEEANLRKPFETTDMNQKDFLDWKGHIEDLYRPISEDIGGERILMKNIRWMNFGWGEETNDEGEATMVHHPDEVWVRFGFQKSEPWKKVRVLRPTADNQQTPQTLYSNQLPISAKKVKDLRKLAKHVPEPQSQFYFNIRAEAAGDEGSTDDEEYGG